MCKPSSGLLLAFAPPMSVLTQPGQTYRDQYPKNALSILLQDFAHDQQKLTAFKYLVSSFTNSCVQSKPGGKTEPDFFFFGIKKIPECHTQKGRGVIDVTCQKSIRNVVWNHKIADSLFLIFQCLSRVATRTSCSQSPLTLTWFVFFPMDFWGKERQKGHKRHNRGGYRGKEAKNMRGRGDKVRKSTILVLLMFYPFW